MVASLWRNGTIWLMTHIRHKLADLCDKSILRARPIRDRHLEYKLGFGQVEDFTVTIGKRLKNKVVRSFFYSTANRNLEVCALAINACCAVSCVSAVSTSSLVISCWKLDSSNASPKTFVGRIFRSQRKMSWPNDR